MDMENSEEKTKMNINFTFELKILQKNILERIKKKRLKRIQIKNKPKSRKTILRNKYSSSP